MRAAGYVLLLGGGLLFRQVAVGRAVETPEDIRDLSLAVFGGDMATAKSVLSRRGTNVESTDSAGQVAADSASVHSTPLIAEVIKLGNAAKGYRLGATGPDYYDCSGLIWRACKNVGIYKGPRFTTHVFAGVAHLFCSQSNEGAHVGDIVLWSSRHMGICTGKDRMYSARSTAKGIGESTISGDAGYFGRQPSYWTPVGDS